MSPGKKYIARYLAAGVVIWVGLALIFAPLELAIDGLLIDATISEAFRAFSGLRVGQMSGPVLGIAVIVLAQKVFPEETTYPDIKEDVK